MTAFRIVFVIEWQQRSKPHIHILIVMDQQEISEEDQEIGSILEGASNTAFFDSFTMIFGCTEDLSSSKTKALSNRKANIIICDELSMVDRSCLDVLDRALRISRG
eukprot:GHVU01124203.1.p1 GENE.GHVU01124203.1~~GHVU01124203.1.p1  ORF type:complete len:106 (-),score=14.66 GHVU01124203.1:999-1316(-)